MRVASLDFGSNTTLLLIAEVRDGKIQNVLCDETRVTKMGQGVHQSRKFHPDALKRIEDALRDYKSLIEKHSAEKVVAVATSAARDVENSNELFDLAKSFGIQLTVISGTEEAELTYRGAYSDKSEKPDSCVIDVGGGSTELIYKDKKTSQIIGASVDVGSVRLMDLFGKDDPMPMSEFLAMRTYIRERLNPVWPKLGLKSAVGVAGTPTILAAMELELETFDPAKIDGFVLRKSVLENWMLTLRGMTLSERENVRGLPPQRADVIVAGCAVLFEFLDHVGLSEMEVSVRGVRYGAALT